MDKTSQINNIENKITSKKANNEEYLLARP